MEELAWAHRQNWYIVFDTLTFNEEIAICDQKRLRSAWRNYLYRWRAAMMVKNDADKSHRYVAIGERGEDTGRFHIHVLHLMDFFPIEWRDPNIGQMLPKYREIAAAKKCWSEGYSAPIAVRTSANDAFGRAGWRWPVVKNEETWEPLEAKGPGPVAGYMAKYVSKSLFSKGEDQTWRDKMTRSFGETAVMMAMQTISSSTLSKYCADLQTTTPLPRLNNKKIPPEMIRKTALRELKRRTNLRKRSLNTLVDLTSRPGFLEQLRTNSQTNEKQIAALRQQNNGSFAHQDCQKEAISELYDALYLIFQELEFSQSFTSGEIDNVS